MFAIDTGSTGSEGPWLVWAARPSHDGKIPARTFYVRHSDGSKVPTDLTKGVVLDIDALKTGWCESEGIKGVAPKWVWGASPAALPPQPGEDYKRGFQMTVATGKGDTDVVVWEQSGAAVWSALTDLAPTLAQRPGNQLPVVRLTGVKEHNFTRGSTAQPVLELVKWTDRPGNLTGRAAVKVDAGPVTQPAVQPVQPAAPVTTAQGETITADEW